jgi:20S proteasome alpha/beta subunit
LAVKKIPEADFIRHLFRKKSSLTYLLGVRCSDGIVMISDRKISGAQGADNFDNKIFQDIPYIVVGASGVVGLYDKFRILISQIVAQDPNMAPMDFIRQCERLVYDINREYVERTRGETIELLIAYGRNKIGELQYISPNGVGEIVKKYQAIGSGEPYGAYFLKKLCNGNITMRQAAIIGWFIINHIEQNALDDGVGIGKYPPQIWFTPHQPLNEEFEKMPEEEQARYEVREIVGIELNELYNDVKQMGEAYERILMQF